MIWQASNSLGNKFPILDPTMLLDFKFLQIEGERGSLFTGILYDHYTAPPGFCFDFTCSTDKDPVNTPFIDNPKSPEYNIPQKVKIKLGPFIRKNY